MTRFCKALALLFLAAAVSEGTATALTTGYTFNAESDSLKIKYLSGLGTRGDPVVIHAELQQDTPTVMAIRATKPINPFAHPRTHATGTIHFDIRIRNTSGQPWVAVEFELQEVLQQPSVYGDGLSFDQRREGDAAFSADVYRDFRLDFEPYDRLLFENGVVDPNGFGWFSLLVTDLTPAAEFYLQFDPQVPAM